MAKFPAGDGTDSSFEFTADIEILRGQLAQALYEATKDSAEYVFGDQISRMDEQSDSVRVDFSSGTLSQEFDLVIVADGQNSSTRDLAFGGKLPGETRSLDQWMAWFSISDLKHDDRSWRWYNAPGGRCVSMRPADNDTRGNLAIIGHGDELRRALEESVADQKALWRQLFADAGWKTDRALQGMDEANNDFYMQEVLQIKLHKWSTGRVVLLGDAAYAPSPISGMGTTCAITGAYVLAGEVARNPTNLCKAFDEYESKLRPMIEKAQQLPPGAPQFANPQTQLGISILNGVLKFASWPGVFKFFKSLGMGNPPANSIDLEDYDFSSGQ